MSLLLSSTPSTLKDLLGSLGQSAGKEIFQILSYACTEDVELFVMQLQKELEERAHGFSVWLDKTDIPLGLDWPVATGTQVESRYLTFSLGFYIYMCVCE